MNPDRNCQVFSNHNSEQCAQFLEAPSRPPFCFDRRLATVGRMQARRRTDDRQLSGATHSGRCEATRPAPASILELPSAVLARIERAATRGYPYEVCGVLLGWRHPDVVRVQRAVRLRNLSVSRRADRYLLDPEGFLKVDMWARGRGLDIVGVWHSHPDSPAQPSETDRELAWPGYAYLIVAVTAVGVRDRCSWEFDGAGFREQLLRTEEPSSRWRGAP